MRPSEYKVCASLEGFWLQVHFDACRICGNVLSVLLVIGNLCSLFFSLSVLLQIYKFHKSVQNQL